MLLDLEISLVKSFGWSLYEIDQTDVTNLFDFVIRLNQTHGEDGIRKEKKFADEVDWL